MIFTEEKVLLYDQLYDFWRRYIDFYVVGNDHLKDVYFHVIIGAILRYRNYYYLESGQKHSTRIHVFSIQNSGTGKSQTMKAAHWLLEYLNIESRYTTRDNEAAMTGTMYRDEESGKIIITKGMLSRKFFLAYDEGRVLLAKTAYNQDLTDFLQMAMDEPGMVSKGMKHGSIDYESMTSLVSGSYMMTEFKDTLLTKGFLQRMYITFREFMPKELEDMRLGVLLLKRYKNTDRIDKLKLSFKMLADRIPVLENGIIPFNIEDVQRFGIDLEKTYREKIQYQFAKEKQDILETFFNRLHVMIDKIAAQRAIVNGKREVTYDDLQYGYERCREHIESLLRMFSYLKLIKTDSSILDRELTIINVIRMEGGFINQSTLLKRLKELVEKGKWDLGINRTLNLISHMVENKKVYMEKGENNSKILFLAKSE